MIRIIYLVRYEAIDEVYESARIIVWTVAECGLSIITASLPIIRVLFKRPTLPNSDGSGSRVSYFFSRNKLLRHHGPGTRSWDKYNRRGWSSTKSQDESQVEIVQDGDAVPSGKTPASKDEEMNWGAIELAERENDMPVTNANSKMS